MQGGDYGGVQRSERRPESEDTSQSSDDRLYRALTSARRRRLLYLLFDEDEYTIETIATLLTGWEATETGTIQTADDRKRVLITLKHVHIPLLVEAELVAYDRQRETLRIESFPALVEDLVRQSIESRSPTS